MEREKTNDYLISLLFIIIPTVLIIIGLIYFTYGPHGTKHGQYLNIPLFSGLLILLFGSIINKYNSYAKHIKIIGWIILAFFWSTLPNTLYYGEEGDFVNAFICIAGVYVLFYIAYHEWLSIKRNENVNCLNWMAGAAGISGLIYFGIELTPLELWLREVVANHSGALLNIFTGRVTVNEIFINYKSTTISIIFACTAVQSMVIFVGMIFPLTNVKIKKKIIGICVTVIPVYFLNLVRNAGVVYLTEIYGQEFFGTAHNVIGKGGSLIALIVLLLIVIKIIPEVFDEILSIADLYKRNGPLEQIAKKIIGRKK